MQAMSDLNLSMFRAYDIRTPAAQLTPGLAERLFRAEAAYFREDLGVKTVILARDARSSGPAYFEMGAEILTESGLQVRLIPGVCSTSLFYFAGMLWPEAGGIMIGASHNPSGDTGQKLIAPGVRPIAESIGPFGGLDRIKDLYIRGAGAKSDAKGEFWGSDPTEEYIRHSMKLAGVREEDLIGLKMLHDYVHGAAGREMLLAFSIAGAQLTPLHHAADGAFPLGDPNPVKAEVIAEGLGRLKSGSFDLGIFFDGDGDRIDFYLGKGDYLASSFVYAAILPEVRQRFGGQDLGVFADLKSNPLAVIEMARSGFHTRIIRNGHSQIKNSLFEDRSMIGAVEESAHFYEAFEWEGERYCAENTLYIALLVSRCLCEEPERFERMLQLQRQTAREREWGYKFPSDDMRQQALDAVRTAFEQTGAISMTRMPNGCELEASLLRRNLPFEIGQESVISPDWLQVCQRVSQSETGLARWEVVAATTELASEARARIASIVAGYGAGEEYQG